MRSGSGIDPAICRLRHVGIRHFEQACDYQGRIFAAAGTGAVVATVEAILVDQSVMGKILNYGSLTLTGTGGVTETFGNISNPLEFRRRVQGEAAKELPARDALLHQALL